MHFPVFGTMAAVVLLLGASAAGASEKDRAGCLDESGDKAIAACTRVIEDRNEPAANRVRALSNRASEWRDKNDHDRAIADYSEAIKLDPQYAPAYYGRAVNLRFKRENDRAIADFSEAIRIDPKYAVAYNNRGHSFYRKQEYGRAMADFNEAIRLDPKYIIAYANRGMAWRDQGEYDRAIPEFNEAMRLDPDDKVALHHRGLTQFFKGDFGAAAADLLRANDGTGTYEMIWRFLARARTSQNGAVELGADVKMLKDTDWPYAVIDFYLGRRSVSQLRAAAANATEKCDAEFYIGQWHVIRGNSVDAAAALQKAVDTCPKSEPEYVGAVAELKRLKR